ncbi:hypothetical protein AACH06_18375 [Ideonella sp. DXS29W]|uniref:Uncharacterized protein n=1 Tax=Ideonella lacteola TaxID=2984193 RepID=A0ABU9BSM2_9BURK
MIPEAFWRDLREDQQTLLMVSSSSWPINSRVGVYDSGILCADCEQRLNMADTYGAETLLTKFSSRFHEYRDQARGLVGYEAVDVDRDLLLQFLVSVLWRASVSSHDFFRRVELGPWEDRAKEVTFGNVKARSVGFDAVLRIWARAGRAHTPAPVLDPDHQRWDGVRAYTLYLGRLMAVVKVDSLPFTQPFVAVSVAGTEPLRAVLSEFERAKEFNLMVKMARQSEEIRRMTREQRAELMKRGASPSKR